MTDLVCVVADKQIQAAVSGLLERPAALGIRPITREILLHPEHDPGCFHRPAEILRGYRQAAEHALLVLDHDWDGVPTTSGTRLESLIDEKFRGAGMADWAAPVVIDPELEAWVFGASPHVAEVLGWRGPGSLRAALELWSFWEPDARKPADPKAALERVLATTGKSRSASLFRSLARKVNTRNCQDRAVRAVAEFAASLVPAGHVRERRGRVGRIVDIPPRFAGKLPVNPDAQGEFARGAPWNSRARGGRALLRPMDAGRGGEATVRDGMSEKVRRVVDENCKTLRFRSHAFEEE